MKKIILLSATFLMMLWMTITLAANASDPVSLLNGIADKMIAKLQENQTTLKENPTLVYSFANALVVPHADIPEMSKRVLPPRVWNEATPEQRSKFEKEFTTMLVRTYASALAEYKDETIRFYPVRGGYQGKDNVKVDSTIIRTDGPSIAVGYRLILRGSEWKLYDLIVEGVSMLESFRSQFADQLSRGNMQDLIQKLEEHNAGNNAQ